MRALILALSILAGPAFACGGQVTMTGTLRQVESKHPNGTIIEAIQLVADTAVEATSAQGSGCISARVVQLVAADGRTADAFASRLGQRITVSSPDVFEAHTAWHIGQAVAMAARLSN